MMSKEKNKKAGKKDSAIGITVMDKDYYKKQMSLEEAVKLQKDEELVECPCCGEMVRKDDLN